MTGRVSDLEWQPVCRCPTPIKMSGGQEATLTRSNNFSRFPPQCPYFLVPNHAMHHDLDMCFLKPAGKYGLVNDFAHKNPGKIPPDFPLNPKQKNMKLLQKLLVKGPKYLPTKRIFSIGVWSFHGRSDPWNLIQVQRKFTKKVPMATNPGCHVYQGQKRRLEFCNSEMGGARSSSQAGVNRSTGIPEYLGYLEGVGLIWFDGASLASQIVTGSFR